MAFFIHMKLIPMSCVTGQLKVGDQLLEVNGINLIGVTREE